MSFDFPQNLQKVFFSQFDQNELQEHLEDIQTLVLSDNKNEYDYEPKELDTEDIIILEETTYEKTCSRYTKEISKVKAKPIIS
ncbi:12129_t:CDS:2 [Dentiscutata erythropus]|uniref:12129_t:CDS:1 n=1 Tax=Dentiscutata erythropus TaxID=1348616 RepID=A0A9N9B0R7_9GLOM|nr:12129_t:CDS:2 [Dentiscutata erythropus]